VWFGGENTSLNIELKWINNIVKTKFMMLSPKYYNKNEYVKIGICNFEIVKNYTYRGTVNQYSEQDK
jgi:hypothetical protein